MKICIRLSLALVSCLLCSLLAATGEPPSVLAAEPDDGVAAARDNHLDERWRAWDALPYSVKIKVDPRILAELRGDILPVHRSDQQLEGIPGPSRQAPLERTRFFVYLRQQPDLSALAERVFASQVEERTALLNLLTTETTAAQAGVKSLLDTQMAAAGVAAYQPFFIVNTLAVEGDLATLIQLAQRDDVTHLVANYPLVALQATPTAGSDEATVRAADLHPDNWNIQLVGADRVWSELGVRGEGAVVAGFDTGVSWQHPALAASYRGRLPDGGVNHNYNWFEPDANLYTGGNLGPSRSTEPYDCSGHGTHTMGTMVGDGGVFGRQIGMAPAARWIALPGICEGTMPGGIRDDIGALKAFQWLLCPTDLSGDLATADCSKAPDVVNNSWGSANPVNDVLRPAIQQLRAGGVAPVFAAGNPDAGPGSIGAPGNAPEAITVGATDSADRVAYFSGRGPSVYPGEQKPELSAPGVDVLSSIGAVEYYPASGTSMAAPHVAGLVALLVSGDLRDGRRDLDVDEIERLMIYSARDLGAPGPDDDYGYGRIDAFAAVRRVLFAGDLQGLVRAAGSNTPIANAIITVVDGAGASFDVTTNSSGVYSTSVPVGTYAMSVRAWGYQAASVAAQEVFADSVSVVDFSLPALPRFALTGVVRSGGAPLAGAQITLLAEPNQQTMAALDGIYTLSLPAGVHTLDVRASGHRSQQVSITVTAGPVSLDISLETAPSILLVEPDASGGWFFSWPLGELYRTALDEQNYPFDHWRVEDISIIDTVTTTVGALIHGVPSAATLSTYDVVIWAHNGCSPYWGCPYSLIDRTLPDFLAGGGRLIYSAQDGGLFDGSPLLDEGLHADSLAQIAAGEGDTLTGQDFLQGIQLTLTNATLYGFANGTIPFSPDAVSPQPGDGVSYPVMYYDNEAGAAALASDPCNGPGRALYLAMGYENLAPRAKLRNPAFSELLGRGVAWVQGQKPAHKLVVAATRQEGIATPGGIVRYEVLVTNAGRDAAALTFDLSGQQWPTRLLRGQQELPSGFQLAPCTSVTLAVLVSPPADAPLAMVDATTLTLADAANPAGGQSLLLQTMTSAAWQSRPAQPFPRFRMGVAAGDERTLYSVGGWSSYYDYLPEANSVVTRYDACRREWTVATYMPEARAEAAAAILGGKLYVIGGRYFSYLTYTAVTSASVSVYDPTSETWTAAADLPTPLTGMAAVAYDGKLYLFGGVDDAGQANDRVLVYDPASDRWQFRAPMPGGGRYFVAAAAIAGKIYVAGGFPDLPTTEVYDPARDAWTVASALRRGRQSAALVTGPDGALYLLGGGNRRGGLASTERYDPQTNQWSVGPALGDNARIGIGAAYVGGEIVAVGGWRALTSESLHLGDSFCLSDKRQFSAAVVAGYPTTYTVELHSGPETLNDVRLVDRIPDGLRFLAFEQNPIGASYNETLRQVEWQGTVPANMPPVALVYQTELADTTLTPGHRFVSDVTFQLGELLSFTRTVTSILLQPDFSTSRLVADRARVKSGDVLTYTVQFQGANLAGGALALRDPLPAGMNYVPGSLHYPFGLGHYDAGTHTIHWEGVQPPVQLVSNELNYVWGDSDGRGELPGVAFAWEDVATTGAPVSGYDDEITCGLPIGFSFTYYDAQYEYFCMSTNGFLTFDGLAGSALENECPLPTPYGNNAVIAAIWDDLIVMQGMTYQTVADEHGRRLIAQWSGIRRFGAPTAQLAEFQVILAETGGITVQVRDAGALDGYDSTTGIENQRGDTGVTYACNRAGSLHDQLAIRFAPSIASPGPTLIHFGVTPATDLGVNRTISNTVILTAPNGVMERSVTTLVNPVDLSASSVTVSQRDVTPNQVVTVTVRLHNTGLVDANSLLAMTVPTATTLVDGSLVCTAGSCTAAAAVVRWQGLLAGETPVTITLGLRLTTPLPDRTPVTSRLTLDDGFGGHYEQEVTFFARRADLGASVVELRPAFVEPGNGAQVLFFVRNRGVVATNAALRHQLPAGVEFEADSLSCSVAGCAETQGVVTWRGPIPARGVVQIGYHVRVPLSAPYGTIYTFPITVDDEDWGDSFVTQGRLQVARLSYLPLIRMPDGSIIFMPMVQAVEGGEEEPMTSSFVRQ
jgi:uncharacterized repeat protein (TIGR01451 family)